MTIRRISVITALCGVLLAWGCGKDDGPTDPGGGGGGTGGEFAAALAAIDQEYFAGHAAAFGSLEALGPYVAALIGTRGAGGPAATDATKAACFPNLAAGTTYGFAGGFYAATDRPGAGPNAVRFLLYGVDPQGALDPQTETGYFELLCSDVSGLVLTGRVVMAAAPDNPLLEFTLNGDSGYYELNGGIASVSGAGQLTLLVQSSDWITERSFTVTLEVPGFTVGYGMWDYLDAGEPAVVDSTRVGLTAMKWTLTPPQTIVLEVMAQVMLAPNLDVEEGLLTYSGELGNTYLIGCFAGTLHEPVIRSVAAGQCNPGYLEVQAVGAAELSAYSAAFVGLTDIYEMIRGFFSLGLVVGGA